MNTAFDPWDPAAARLAAARARAQALHQIYCRINLWLSTRLDAPRLRSRECADCAG